MNKKLESRISRLEKLLLKNNRRAKNEQWSLNKYELSTLQQAFTDLGNAREKLGNIGLLSMDLKNNVSERAANKFDKAYNNVQDAIDELALLLDELGVYKI